MNEILLNALFEYYRNDEEALDLLGNCKHIEEIVHLSHEISLWLNVLCSIIDKRKKEDISLSDANRNRYYAKILNITEDSVILETIGQEEKRVIELPKSAISEFESANETDYPSLQDKVQEEIKRRIRADVKKIKRAFG